MCLELALEGERLCKSGDCRAGVAFFQVSLEMFKDSDRMQEIFILFLGCDSVRDRRSANPVGNLQPARKCLFLPRRLRQGDAVP